MFKRKWDDQSIIDHIMSKYGKKPLNSSYYATNYSAVYAAAERIFGSWKYAIEACGLDYNTIRKYKIWSKEIIIRKIKTTCKTGQPLSSNYTQKNNRPLYMAALKRYKNWGAAVTAAGFDYKKVRLRRMMSKAEIKKEILELYARNVDLAYPNMREKYQYLLAAGMKKLGNGSWEKARKVCGLHVNFRLSDEKIKAWRKANG
ncbi:MAG: hypothetical protein NT118_15200 [Lentisphaerae bacterium]|nr:hypothetical protein [Lentisphaerota bacterium]